MNTKQQPLRLVINKTPRQPGIKGVYLITDHEANLVQRVTLALRGGVSVLQYRAKDKDFDACLSEGAELKKLCRDYGVPFIVNDDLKLAQALDADGVHLGQDDASLAEARQCLGPDKIIGISTHNIEEALKAENEGADYIGFGAMYPTGSKHVTHMPGTAGLSAIRDKIRIPVVAIGGITTSNACRVIDAGADALAIISSILSSPRPDMAAMEFRLLFNRRESYPRGSVLTVAGSDSGGGAGIQADIKTITLLGSYAASVLTALTAQNTREVSSIHGLPPSFVIEQLNAVLSDIHVDVIKTGMLHTPAIISAVAEYLTERRTIVPLVIDPVMIATSGAALMEPEAIKIFKEQLLPLSYLLTPNIPEAERLLCRAISTENDMEQAARELHAMGAANVIIKGGHLTGRNSTDVLFNGRECFRFSNKRIFTINTHGTGCTYASAIAALLSQGEPLKNATEKAKNFITTAISLAKPIGKGRNPVNHFAAVNSPESAS